MPSLRHVLPALVAVLALVGCAVVPPPPVTVVAENIAFTPARFQVPTAQPFHVSFENRDAGVPHGLSLRTRTSGVEPRELWASEIQSGPSRAEFDLPSLAPGPYVLMCPVHPNMQIEVDAG